MKKLFTFMMMEVVLFTACINDDEPVVESNEGKSVTIRASIAGEAGTRVALGDTDEKKVNWTSGDQITLTINGESYTFTFVDDSENEFEYTPENGGKTLPALAADMVITAAYVGENVSGGYTNQSGTKEEVTKFMSLSATKTVTTEQRYSDLNLTFTHNTSVVKLALSHEDFKANDVTKIELNVGGSAKIVTTSTFEKDSENGTITAYVAVAPEALSNITLYAESENNGLYYADLSDITLVAGKLYQVTKTMEAVPFVTFTTTNAAQTLNINNTVNNLEYSADNGSWTTLSANTDVSFEKNIRLRAVNSQGTNVSIISFGNNDVKVAGSGDIRTLIDYKNHRTITTNNAKFAYLFKNCTALTSAPELPITDLAGYCYQNMFYGCTSLGTAPALPATTLSKSCYQNMFYGCTSLETAPQMAATTLAEECCFQMFSECTSLTTAPQLQATNMEGECYYKMFYNCTSLETIPGFTVSSTAKSCCYFMFYNCSKLQTAPVTLSATTLAEECYYAMFAYTKLQEAPVLPATTLAYQCYGWMFGGCTSLQTAPVLSATTLANDCYVAMFNGCTSLQMAPELPATELTTGCYNVMFKGCTSLQKSPVLKAETLVNSCYFEMFADCSSLNEVTMLAITDVNTTNLYNWLSGVASTGTFNKAPGEVTGLQENSASGIPSGWTTVEYKATIITDPTQAVKGDLALSDGTFISKDDINYLTDEQKTNVRGIVFWTEKESGNATLTSDAVMSDEYPDYNHGLIVALTNVSEGCTWQSNYSSIANWQNSNSPYNGTDYKSIASPRSNDGNIKYILGYQNTKVLEAYNKYCDENSESNYKVNPVAELTNWKTSNFDIANTTGWFVPSVKELHMLCYKDVDDLLGQSYDYTTTRTAIDPLITALGGTALGTNWYWSSSEYAGANNSAFGVAFGSCYVGDFYKSPVYSVRAVCAY